MRICNDVTEILADIKSIECDKTLFKESNFDSRANSLDFVDFHIIERIEIALEKQNKKKQLQLLKHRAKKLKEKLELVNTILFKRIVKEISFGTYIGGAFLTLIGQLLPHCHYNSPSQTILGYDNSDDFINRLLCPLPLPDETLTREPEMVFYQQTPFRIILEMTRISNLTSEDVFFDIGSGLGHVPILVNLIAEARANGVEYEPAYCQYARSCAKQLNLGEVKFINSDARHEDYSRGTVFFMYTPFDGYMLQDMLDVLLKESLTRAITIFTYGRCSYNVAQQNWLHCTNGPVENIYQLYRFEVSETKY